MKITLFSIRDGSIQLLDTETELACLRFVALAFACITQP